MTWSTVLVWKSRTQHVVLSGSLNATKNTADHSHHIADQCIYRRARVGRDRLSRIVLLPGPDCSVVLCVGPVPPVDLASCTRIGPLYVPESGIL